MDSLRETTSLLISAIIGSFVGAAFRKDESTFSIFISVVAGISTSYYITPAIVVIFGLTDPLENAIAFILGLLGMCIITMLMSIFTSLTENPRDTIEYIKVLIKDLISRRTTTINNYSSKEETDHDNNR